MDDEERQTLAIGLAQSIAMQAMELPPKQRPEFIKRAVLAVRAEFERQYGADPAMHEAAYKLQALTETKVELIEESSGSAGHV